MQIITNAGFVRVGVLAYSIDVALRLREPYYILKPVATHAMSYLPKQWNRPVIRTNNLDIILDCLSHDSCEHVGFPCRVDCTLY